MRRIDTFSRYLDVVGFSAAPFAWYMSGIPVDDHDDIIDALGRDRTNETE